MSTYKLGFSSCAAVDAFVQFFKLIILEIKNVKNSLLATGGCLKCITYCVTALGWLQKEEDEHI